MNCYLCDGELIWGGDHDAEPEDDHLIETNLHCAECGATVVVYHPDKPDG